MIPFSQSVGECTRRSMSAQATISNQKPTQYILRPAAAATLLLLPLDPRAPSWDIFYFLYTLWLSHQIPLLSLWFFQVPTSAPPLIQHPLPGSKYYLYRCFFSPSPNTVSVQTFSHQQHLSLSTVILTYRDSLKFLERHLQPEKALPPRNFVLSHSCSVSGKQHHHPLSRPLQKPGSHRRRTWGQRWCLVYFTIIHQDVLDSFWVQDGNLSLYRKLHRFPTT